MGWNDRRAAARPNTVYLCKRINSANTAIRAGCLSDAGQVAPLGIAIPRECRHERRAASADSGSKQLFEQLLRDEEGHFDQFEKQRDNIRRFGLSYLALQSFGAATGMPAAGAPTAN